MTSGVGGNCRAYAEFDSTCALQFSPGSTSFTKHNYSYFCKSFSVKYRHSIRWFSQSMAHIIEHSTERIPQPSSAILCLSLSHKSKKKSIHTFQIYLLHTQARTHAPCAMHVHAPQPIDTPPPLPQKFGEDRSNLEQIHSFIVKLTF